MNLDEFITACSDRGELESEGTFSVDSLAALRKTLSSSLPEPHFYLLQILQGLAKAGATDIKVAIGRRENKVTFQSPKDNLINLDSLEQAFTKGLSVSSPKIEDLLMSGLVTSLGSYVSSAEIHHENEKICVTVMGLVRQNLSKPTTVSTVILKRAIEKGLAFSWSRIWGARKEEFRVRKAFEYAPTPLHIAGLPTTPRSGWRRGIDADQKFTLLEVAILAQRNGNHRGEEQTGLKPLATNSGYYRCETSVLDVEENEVTIVPNLLMVALDESGETVKGTLLEQDWQRRLWTFCFTNSKKEMGEVTFIRNGLAVERVEHDLGIPGVHVVAPADDLQVDATGYKLVRNDLFNARVSEAKERTLSIKSSHLKRENLNEALTLIGRDPEATLDDLSWL